MQGGCLVVVHDDIKASKADNVATGKIITRVHSKVHNRVHNKVRSKVADSIPSCVTMWPLKG